MTKSTSGNANLFSQFSKTFYIWLDLTNKEFSNGFYRLFHIAIKLNNFLSELQNISDTLLYWIIKYIALFFILRFDWMKYNINADIHVLMKDWTLQVMTKLSNSRLNFFIKITKLQEVKKKERNMLWIA